MVFDNPATINKGSGWDSSKNSFIAPVTGIYYTHWAFSALSSSASVILFVNNNPLVEARISTLSKPPYNRDTMSCGHFMQLNANDVVYVSMVSDNGSFVPSAFGGFLYAPPFAQVSTFLLRTGNSVRVA